MTYPSGRGLSKSQPPYYLPAILTHAIHASLTITSTTHSLPRPIALSLSPHRSPSLHLELRKWQWSIPANYRCPPWPLLSPLLSPTPHTFSYYLHYSPLLSPTLSYYLPYSILLPLPSPTISPTLSYSPALFYSPYSLLLSPLLSPTISHTISPALSYSPHNLPTFLMLLLYVIPLYCTRVLAFMWCKDWFN